MKTTRVLLLSAVLVLVAACGTKGDLVLPGADADATRAGSSLPTGGTSRPPATEEPVNTGDTPAPNADGELPDEDAGDE